MRPFAAVFHHKRRLADSAARLVPNSPMESPVLDVIRFGYYATPVSPFGGDDVYVEP